MKNFLFKGKIARYKFEEKLMKHFDPKLLFAKQENNSLLYYVDGKHIATWMTHDAWIFSKEIINDKST